MKDQVTVRFPDGSKKETALTLSETDLRLGEFCIELCEVTACSAEGADCRLLAADAEYSLSFATEKKCARFVAAIEAGVEELEEAPPRAARPAPAQKKRLRTGGIIAIIVAAVVLLAAVAVGLYLWRTSRVVPAYGENDASVKAVYCQDTLSQRELDAVVVVDAQGEAVLDNAALQIYHWTEYYTFMNYYGSYASMVGLNSSASLDSQTAPDGSGTWEQFFLEGAISNFGRYYALARAAEADGYALNEEDSAIVEDVLDPEGDFATNVTSYGFSDVAGYLDQNYGPYVTLEDYYDYMRTYILAAAYYEDVLYASVNDALTDAEVEAYFDENAASYGDIKYNNVSVRHILIQPEGEKDSVTNTWSDEAWAAAEEKINEVYALWQEDPTVENFETLVAEYSADTASVEAGGLYENFAAGTMDTGFNDWCFLQAHEPGDTGIAKSSHGYHIIYFVEQTETRGWFDTARSALINERLTTMVEEIRERYPIHADYAQMCLFDMVGYNVVIK